MDKFKFEYSIGIPEEVSEVQSTIQFISELPFNNIEIPGIWLETSGLAENLDLSRVKITGVRDLIAPLVSGSIADQKSTIINGFIEKLILLIGQLEVLQTDQFSLNTGIETALRSQEKMDSRILLLKKIAPYLYRKQLKLSIPVRLPSVTTASKGKYASILKETMCGNIRLALNIHPHEAAHLGDPLQLLSEYRFFIDTVSFVYEPETGNILVEKLIKPWFKALEELDYKGPVIFRPRVSNIENFRQSIKNLSALTDK